eukprot:PhM_4_TR13981/c0_g1_i1/m.81555
MGVGVGVADAADTIEDLLLFFCELHISADATGEAVHVVVVAVEEAQQQYVQRARERWREHERQRDVDGVQIVSRVEVRVPTDVAAVDDELCAERCRHDGWAHDRERRDKDRHSLVGVAQQDRMGHALQQTVDKWLAKVAHKKVGVVHAVELEMPVTIDLGAEAELESRELHEVQRHGAALLHLVVRLRRPRHNVRQGLKTRDDVGETVQGRALASVEQVHEKEVVVLDRGTLLRGRVRVRCLAVRALHQVGVLCVDLRAAGDGAGHLNLFLCLVGELDLLAAEYSLLRRARGRARTRKAEHASARVFRANGLELDIAPVDPQNVHRLLLFSLLSDGVAADVVVNVLPELVRLEEAVREQPVKQSVRKERLRALADVCRVRGVAEDDAIRVLADGHIGVGVAGLVSCPR